MNWVNQSDDPAHRSVASRGMTDRIRVAVQWSGGKDSAHALGRLLADDRYDVRCLVTTVHGEEPVSSVHDLPLAVLQAQATAIGVPLHPVVLAGPGLEDYPDAMRATARRLQEEGVDAVAFGDLEHSGARQHREALFGPLGLSVVEPLWGLTSAECMEAYLRTGIEARTVVVDADVLGREHLGVVLDRAFVDGLPEGCDPCGELGEYHSVVTDAPWFRHPVDLTVDGVEHVERRIGTTDGVRTFRYWQLRVRAVGP